ncbi:hypothetical protein [Frankia sp. R82]|uniref:hypothetical protein n=1 Tax=Frankia sp. R82 TaxID=2950553 RepID=UPI0020443BC5|nr:hypothetical protein [Frankia sp. R82]MCM3884182.1 hypothetical protein [Frankia sp. R82]
MSHTTPGITRHRPCAGCGGSIHLHRAVLGIDGQAVHVPAEQCDCPRYVEATPTGAV